MEELKCKNCGAPLTREGKCEYCGSRFHVEQTFGGFHIIEIEHGPAQTLSASMKIPFEARHYMKAENITQYSIRELTKQLAEGLAAYMRLDVMEDPMRMATIVRGTVRVVPPNVRY